MDRGNLEAEDCDGQVLNVETLKKYNGDKTHISGQCSLLMPSTQLAGEKPAGKTFVAYVLPDRSSKAVTANLVDANTSEEDKIEDIKLQSNNEYASIKELDPEPTVYSAPLGHQSRPLHSHRGRGRHWERAGPREGVGSPSPFRSRSPIGLRNRSPDLNYKSRSIRDRERDGMSLFPRDYTHHGRGRRGAPPHHAPSSFPLGTKSKEYASINYFKKPCVPPPPDYICNACGKTDHHIQECPMLLDKRPDPKPGMKSEGVSHSFMVKAEPGTKGDMFTIIGEKAIPAIDAEAYVHGKKECPSLVADKDSPMHATSQGQPPSPVELDPEPTVYSAPLGHQSRPLHSHRGRGRHWERAGPREGVGSPSPFRSRSPIGLRNRSPDLNYKSRSIRDRERDGMSLFPRDYTHHGRRRRGAPPHHAPSSFPLGTKSRTKVLKTKKVPKKRPREEPEQSDHSVDRDDSPKRKRVKALHRGSPA